CIFALMEPFKVASSVASPVPSQSVTEISRLEPKQVTKPVGLDYRPFLRSIMSLAARGLVLCVSFVNPFHPVIAHAARNKEFAELVDIVGHRKMYLECKGTGSPTVVLISGTRGAHDDWTDLIDPNNPIGAMKPGESAVFPQVSKFTRVCAYDR